MESPSGISIPLFKDSHVAGITICELPASLTVHNRYGLNPVYGQKTPSHLVIDCGNCSHIDTAALGTLVSVRRHLREVGRKLVLANVRSGEVEHALRLCKLDTLFTIKPSVAEAIDSLLPQFALR